MIITTSTTTASACQGSVEPPALEDLSMLQVRQGGSASSSGAQRLHRLLAVLLLASVYLVYVDCLLCFARSFCLLVVFLLNVSS